MALPVTGALKFSQIRATFNTPTCTTYSNLLTTSMGWNKSFSAFYGRSMNSVAPYTQQQVLGSATGENQGCSCSMSADGKTMAVGAWSTGWRSTSTAVGATTIYKWNGSSWNGGQTVVGSGGSAGNQNQGISCSLSADGNTLAVGGSKNNGGIGATWVFAWNGTIWGQQQMLTGTLGTGTTQSQGVSCSLSSDGNTLAVGGSNDNSVAGAVWIFTRSGTTWSQQAILKTSGTSGYIGLGASCSLSGDGNTLAAGGMVTNTYLGATWVFTRNGTVWSQQQLITGTGATGYQGQGYSCSLSGSGNCMAIGGPLTNANVGATWVYRLRGSVWVQQVMLVGTGATGNQKQGSSCSLSMDGNTLAVGASVANSVGATWIFKWNGSVWMQHSLLSGTGATLPNTVGCSCSLSSDGNMLAVGGQGTNGSVGATWVFSQSTAKQTQMVVGTGATGTQNQGWSCSLSYDGLTLVIGGVAANTNIGMVWIHRWNGSAWVQQTSIVGTGFSGYQAQGSSCALSSDGNTLAFGGDQVNGGVGTTWVYRFGTSWVKQATITATGATVSTTIQNQGSSCSLSADGNTLAIGGFLTNANVGAVWVYRYGSSWVQQNTTPITGPGYGSQTQSQGSSCSLSFDGNTLAFGGYMTNGGVGATWVYRYGSSWVWQATLIGTGATVLTSTQYQGMSCSLSADGNTLAVGGPSTDGYIGATWVYRYESSWVQQAMIQGSGSSGSQKQGQSCRLSSDGNTLVVGGHAANGGVGTTWVFQFNGISWVQKTMITGTGATGYQAQGCSCGLSSDGNTLAVGGFAAANDVGATWTFSLAFPFSLVARSCVVGWYTALGYANGVWKDFSGMGNDATTQGVSYSPLEGGYVYGGAGSSWVLWPVGVLPPTYTLFHVARLNGATHDRIFTQASNQGSSGGATNWLSGFSGGKYKVAYHSGWITSTTTTAPAGVTSWIISRDRNTSYYADGAQVTGGAGAGSPSFTRLSIAGGDGTVYPSDWAVCEVIVVSRVLTDNECAVVESYLKSKYIPVVPGFPLNVVATPGNGSITITFGAPATGSPPTGYTATSTSPTGFSGSSAGSATSIGPITGLTNGTPYTFSVVASNSAGSGPGSSVTATPFTVPGPPTSVTASPSDGSITIAFSPPASFGGSAAFLGYVATSTSPAGFAGSGGPSATSITVSGLTNGTSYTFSLVAYNMAGNSTAVTGISATPAIIYKFTSTNLGWVSPITAPVHILAVGGGGGGGGGWTDSGGGGGGGGAVQYISTTLTAGKLYNISVGSGGTSDGDGSPSTVSSYSVEGLSWVTVSYAEGGGSGDGGGGAMNGGCGGGGSSDYNNTVAGVSTQVAHWGAGYGHDGYGGYYSIVGVTNNSTAGGGGGAGGDGAPGVLGYGGTGGPGISFDIFGSTTFYGAGGGGGVANGVSGAGGAGGGGSGGPSDTNGGNATGYGCGGGGCGKMTRFSHGGLGSAGIVIISTA